MCTCTCTRISTIQRSLKLHNFGGGNLCYGKLYADRVLRLTDDVISLPLDLDILRPLTLRATPPLFLLRKSSVFINSASHFLSSLARTCFCASMSTGVRGRAGRRPVYASPPADTICKEKCSHTHRGPTHSVK